MKKNQRILVLSVDRDDDIGIKASIKGPIVGRENAVKAAVALGIADSTDSDCNALLRAIAEYDEIRKHYEAEIAALTGNKDVGVKSDMEIADQLDRVVRKFRPDYAVLITDGAEDEHVIPIIQSKVPILSIERVVVKQAAQLESSYFKIKDFINESLDNPKYSRIVFGLPALFLVLFGFFGFESFRFVLGIIGIYLFIKGFKLEDYVLGAVKEMQTSFMKSRLTFFAYIITILVASLAAYRGYTSMNQYLGQGFFELVAAFVSGSIYYFFIAVSAGWIGKNIMERRRSLARVIAIPVFGLAISVVVFNSTQLILSPELPIFDFMISLIFGFTLLFLALVIEWKT